MNHGRWIVRCPRCNNHLQVDERDVICPVCWPGMKAKLYQPVENGLLRPVHDMQTIERTREQARQRGEVYLPEFPAERQEIEEILRCRRNIANMNWIPSETVQFLIDENVAHGDPLPERPKGRK